MILNCQPSVEAPNGPLIGTSPALRHRDIQDGAAAAGTRTVIDGDRTAPFVLRHDHRVPNGWAAGGERQGYTIGLERGTWILLKKKAGSIRSHGNAGDVVGGFRKISCQRRSAVQAHSRKKSDGRHAHCLFHCT